MNAATEACTEAWKFQHSEWLHGADKAIVAIARSWFSAGWTAGVVWQASQPITDEMVTAAWRAHHIENWGDDLDPEDEGSPRDRDAIRAALEATRGVQS